MGIWEGRERRERTEWAFSPPKATGVQRTPQCSQKPQSEGGEPWGREALGINNMTSSPNLSTSIIQFLQPFPHPAPSERGVCVCGGGAPANFAAVFLSWWRRQTLSPPLALHRSRSTHLSSGGVGLLGSMKPLLFRQNLQRGYGPLPPEENREPRETAK